MRWFWMTCKTSLCWKMHGPWIGLVVELLHSAFVQYPCVDAALFLSRCCLLSLSLFLAFFVLLLRCQVSLSCIVLNYSFASFFGAASSCQFSGHQLRILQFTFCLLPCLHFLTILVDEMLAKRQGQSWDASTTHSRRNPDETGRCQDYRRRETCVLKIQWGHPRPSEVLCAQCWGGQFCCKHIAAAT